MSRVMQIARVCFDVFIFAVLGFAEYGIHKWMKPTRRGFFCGDESLKYPYSESSISVGALLAIAFLVPNLVIAVVELFKPIESAQKKSTSSGCRLGHRLVQCYKQLGCYLFGLALTVLATELPKNRVGRLRPHFFAVCQPQLMDGTTCEEPENHDRFHEQYICANQNSTAHMIDNVGQSFPSGHASIMFYAMLYLAIYLEAQLTTRASKLFKHLLQFIAIMFAWHVALTRVAEFWHHWTDVLAGALLGIIIAFAVAKFVAGLFAANNAGATKTPMNPSASLSSSAKSVTPVLPTYNYGSMPYLHYPPHQYGQTYHNYGYVP